MKRETAVETSRFPVPEIVPFASMYADEHNLIVRYDCVGGVAIIQFSSELLLRFGFPNDEGLAGHPLYEHGLSHYGVYSVINSSLIADLEQMNAHHHRHIKGWHEDHSHFVFTFQDSTLEIVTCDTLGEPIVQVVDPEVADRIWLDHIRRISKMAD